MGGTVRWKGRTEKRNDARTNVFSYKQDQEDGEQNETKEKEIESKKNRRAAKSVKRFGYFTSWR